MTIKRVVVPVADMRREPQHRSERVSQALYGFAATVRDTRDGFDLVQTPDGYEGWIFRDYLRESSGDQPSAVVSSRFASFALDGGGELVLPFGALVGFDHAPALYQDHQTSRRMVLVAGNVDESIGRPKLLPQKIALSLTSAPYLWGGASPFGYDCSGLVQAVFRRSGINLPRDSKDQSACGRQILLSDARGGDLIFFPGHVALCVDDLRIIHATRSRGMVVIESLKPGDSHFRRDLADTVTCVRRLLP